MRAERSCVLRRARVSSMNCRAVICRLAAILFLLLVGCDGGGSCPFQRPSCCDNALFGCGPFDLPQGCSCSDYFSRAWSGVPKTFSIMTKEGSKSTLEGTWRVSLRKSSEGCDYLSEATTQNIQIRERRGKVTARIMGVANMRGDRADRRARLRGKIKTLVPRCQSELIADLSMTSGTTVTIVGSISVDCGDKKLTCSTSYAGSGKRL